MAAVFSFDDEDHAEFVRPRSASIDSVDDEHFVPNFADAARSGSGSGSGKSTPRATAVNTRVSTRVNTPRSAPRRVMTADEDVDDLDDLLDDDKREAANEELALELEVELVEDFRSDDTGIVDDLKLLAMRHQADDFEPIKVLGKGGYGKVLLVKQKSTGKLNAQKQLKKATVTIRTKTLEYTKAERQILQDVRHPFIVKLFYAFQDHSKLYLILQYAEGGELWTHLEAEKMFSEQVAAFYVAELVLALSHLHAQGIIYRDLKPENCLLDRDGHLVLTDFGISKVAAEGAECRSFCGTAEYMPPEMLLEQPYTAAADWWSLGILLYELCAGQPPFTGNNKKKICDRICNTKLTLPYYMSQEVKDLIGKFLKKVPGVRLGAKEPEDLPKIKGHRFFRKIDWVKLEKREVTPPIQPIVTDPELAENFAMEFTTMPLNTPASAPPPIHRAGDGTATPKVDIPAASTTKGSGTTAGQPTLDQQLFDKFTFVASPDFFRSAGLV